MSAHLLIEHFHLLAATPNGVQKLRELILNLAVRGKLVPQDPQDEPASALLKRIQAEKARLVAGGKIKKDKPLPGIGEEEKPYKLPQGWAFSRFGNLLHSIKSGGTPSKQNPSFWDGDIPWASVKDLKFGEPIYTTQDKITEAGLNAGSSLAEVGSILICTRMGLGKIGEARIDVAINQDLKAVTLSPLIDKQYFINFYKTLSIAGSGMTVAGIRQEELLEFIVPLPPLAEQSRIVAKVDELMALCDQLEAQQGSQSQARARLVSTLLEALTQSADAAVFADNWARLAEHFDWLFDTPQSIAQLKQTILQLAVQGKLVTQHPDDEPASELLKKIRAEKDRLIHEGKIKKDRPLPAIGEDEKSYEIPEGWEWVRLADLASVLNGRAYAKHELLDLGTPVLRVGNLFTSNHWYYSDLELEDDKYCDTGDLLFAWSASFGPFIWPGPKAIYHYHIWKLNFFSDSDLNKYYLYKFLLEKTMELKASGHGVSMIHMTKENMEKVVVPVPPLAEQSRIVAKVDELMQVCDALAEKLATSRRLAQQLMETLTEQVA